MDSDNEEDIASLAPLLKFIQKDAEEIRIAESLTGIVDFAVLRDQGFRHAKTIILSRPGKVTEIRNIPQGITHLMCTRQSMKTLGEHLPDSLVEIDCTGNVIETFDGSRISKLKVLRISENQLSKMANLPASLEILECDDNQLQQLSLKGLTHLKTLHCSNNPLLVVENVPEGLTDFLMENTAFTLVSKNGKPHSNGGSEGKFEYLKSIGEFFRLKQAYETKRVKSPMKPPCISCGRKVGTLFKMKQHKYSAECGDLKSPCPLRIEIFHGQYGLLEEWVQIYKENIEGMKERIIKQKMDTMFDYVDESKAVAEFKEELAEFGQRSQTYADLVKSYGDLRFSEDRARKIALKQEEIYKIQADIQRILAEYREKGTPALLTDAVKLQAGSLKDTVHQLRLLKYDVMYMDGDVLVQHAVAFDKTEYLLGEEPRVIKFTVK
jgi:hypothetical protein